MKKEKQFVIKKLIEDYVHDYHDQTLDRQELKRMLVSFEEDIEQTILEE